MNTIIIITLIIISKEMHSDNVRFVKFEIIQDCLYVNTINV